MHTRGQLLGMMSWHKSAEANDTVMCEIIYQEKHAMLR